MRKKTILFSFFATIILFISLGVSAQQMSIEMSIDGKTCGSSGVSLNPKFVFKPDTGSIGYHIVLKKGSQTIVDTYNVDCLYLHRVLTCYYDFSNLEQNTSYKIELGVEFQGGFWIDPIASCSFTTVLGSKKVTDLKIDNQDCSTNPTGISTNPTLTWNGVSEFNSSAGDYYQVMLYQENNLEVNDTTTSESYNFTNLSPNRDYEVRVAYCTLTACYPPESCTFTTGSSPQPPQTCSDLGGVCCPSGETCTTGKISGASDCSECCGNIGNCSSSPGPEPSPGESCDTNNDCPPDYYCGCDPNPGDGNPEGHCYPSGSIVFCPPGRIKTINEIVTEVLNYIFLIAMVLAPLMIIIAALYFIFSGGSAERIATAKRIFFYAIIGLVVGLLAKAIFGIIKMMFGG